MNEPPHPDPRALVVAAGVAVALCAALQVPRLRSVPASIVMVIGAGLATATFVHTHNYPGRMTIHLVPFAAAAAAIGAASLVRRENREIGG
jgi:hypothetical protein